MARRRGRGGTTAGAPLSSSKRAARASDRGIPQAREREESVVRPCASWEEHHGKRARRARSFGFPQHATFGMTLVELGTLHDHAGARTGYSTADCDLLPTYINRRASPSASSQLRGRAARCADSKCAMRTPRRTPCRVRLRACSSCRFFRAPACCSGMSSAPQQVAATSRVTGVLVSAVGARAAAVVRRDVLDRRCAERERLRRARDGRAAYPGQDARPRIRGCGEGATARSARAWSGACTHR